MLAPEYTRQERLRFVVTHAAWAFPLLASLQFYLFPAFKEFANTAPCRDYWGIDGAYLVFIPVFCIPLVSALLLVALWGREYTAILRLAQYPLPGQKVFKPTPYVYGFKAKVRAYVFFSLITLLIGVGIHGLIWSTQFIETNDARSSACCEPSKHSASKEDACTQKPHNANELY